VSSFLCPASHITVHHVGGRFTQSLELIMAAKNHERKVNYINTKS